ncbi:hypothetical protein K443DRAFT_135700 [Laccaria amethystina LaAM-08-1]|uniref:Uncharacterized protein n=1 Tax=Laccaria amethystina LaAM-08-1 TaxID=1095629 RepID=A0A0C9WLB9_9AGAR|nr:hypothetical protein K443DRAFT_135700 [Laccaria amethystina LaAM-08-1]
MALEYKSLEAGSEAWLEIPIVTGATESGKVLVLARVKQCLAEVHNAARQKYVVYVEDRCSDEEMANDTHPVVNSPTASPPAKRVRREETSYEAAGSVQQQARNYHGSHQQKAQDPRVAYQRQVSAPEDSGPDASRTMNPHTRPHHPHTEQNDSESEPVHKPRGTSHPPSAQDDAGLDPAGGFRFRGPHDNYYTDVNMHDEGEHDGLEDYHPTLLEHPHLGQHPRQYGPSGFGGRGRGGRPQYRGYSHPYEFAGYYGQGHEGFTGYGHQRFGRGPLECRQYPGEGHGF